MTKRPLIIDTDTGCGMIHALMLICGCGLFDIKGICTVSGCTSAGDAAVHASFLRDVCGGDFPVIAGAENPMIVRRSGCSVPDDCSVLTEAEAGRKYAPEKGEHPWDFIYRRATELGGEAELFCTGPLTNIATAVIRHRDLPRYIKRITIAAGASRAGNATVYAEYNVYSDPHAFKCVLDAGFRQLDLVELDFCSSAYLNAEETGSCASLPDSNPWKGLLMQWERNRRSRAAVTRDPGGNGRIICHDAAAAFVIAIPAAISTSNVYTMVEMRSDICSGRTLFDFDRRFTDDPNVRLAVYTQREMFADFYLRCMHSFDGRAS